MNRLSWDDVLPLVPLISRPESALDVWLAYTGKGDRKRLSYDLDGRAPELYFPAADGKFVVVKLDLRDYDESEREELVGGLLGREPSSYAQVAAMGLTALISKVSDLEAVRDCQQMPDVICDDAGDALRELFPKATAEYDWHKREYVFSAGGEQRAVLMNGSLGEYEAVREIKRREKESVYNVQILGLGP